jgi:hypothetical protein
MKLRTISVCALVIALVSIAARLRAQDFSKGIRGDDSDWWSIIRRIDSPIYHLNPQKREPAPSNFQILGISLEDNNVFKEVNRKLGPTKAIIRGDAGTARQQLCYASEEGSPKTYLIFEGGEVQFSFYLLSDGRPWNGLRFCTKSRLVTSRLETGSGLRLGMSEAQVERILGKPTLRKQDQLIYWLQAPKKATAANLAKWRRENPQMSDKDFHENYDYYTLTADIEASFSNSKLIYLGVDESEVY